MVPLLHLFKKHKLLGHQRYLDATKRKSLVLTLLKEQEFCDSELALRSGGFSIISRGLTLTTVYWG